MSFVIVGDVALLSPFVGMRHIEISGFVADGSEPSAVKGFLHKNCQNGYSVIESESGRPIR